MGVTNVLYDYGFQYDDPKQPYHMDGFVNSPDAVKGLEFYKELYKCCTAPGMTNAYMSEGLDAFKSGQVAMQMNLFAFFPGLYKDPNVGGDKIGFFVNPAAKSISRSSADRGSRWCPIPNQGRSAAIYQMVRAAGGAEEVVGAGRLFLRSRRCCNDPSFPKSAPFANEFLKSMGIVKDFWAEPSYAAPARHAEAHS